MLGRLWRENFDKLSAFGSQTTYAKLSFPAHMRQSLAQPNISTLGIYPPTLSTYSQEDFLTVAKQDIRGPLPKRKLARQAATGMRSPRKKNRPLFTTPSHSWTTSQR
jgi:hypothetical protein